MRTLIVGRLRVPARGRRLSASASATLLGPLTLSREPIYS